MTNPSFSKRLQRYNYLFNETQMAYHELSLKLGLSDSAMSILYTLLENNGSCLLKTICQYTGISKQTINSSIRKLEADDIIYLKPHDAKNKMVYLTEKGSLFAAKTAGRVIETENEIFSSWTQEDIEKYFDLSEKYMLAIKEKAKNIK